MVNPVTVRVVQQNLTNSSIRRSISTTSGYIRQRYKQDLSDPKTLALHKLYRQERITPRQKGYDLLRNARLNKGLAFSLEERHYFGIHGLLPPAFMNEEQQVYRVMSHFRQLPDNLSKYIFLDDLRGRTEKLFYRVLCQNISELMPIVYTPTVGLACLKFGAIYRRPRGVYITINDNSISKIHQILCNWPERDVKAIVVTDGERILGLGDLGCFGMGIPVGKLSLYVALAKMQPQWCLPVLLDVGTNNEKYIDDPLYIGLRRKRVRGEDYDLLVDNFIKAVTKRFGRQTLIQFEDFGFENAHRLLDKYRDSYCVFNDDIQGTAAVTLAGLLCTTRITKKKLTEQKFLFHGAGTAGLGIAGMMVKYMVLEEGATTEQACETIHMVDIDGLVTKARAEKMTKLHQQFAKDLPECRDLLEIVRTIKPNAIIGVSTQGGAFTAEVLKEMAKINERPIVFPLSNPTIKSECTFEDAIKATDGRVVFASGSPYKKVEYNGKIHKPGQGNNSYIFPGVGLSAVLWRAKTIPDMVFIIAAKACAAMVSEESIEKFGLIYPRLKDIPELSVKIAMDTCDFFYKEGIATLYPRPENLEMYIHNQIYTTHYEEIINKAYKWPEKDSKQGYSVPKLEKSSVDDD